jgi:hypothetical protein
VGDGDDSTSMFASKLPQTWSVLVPKASTDLERSSSQSFHRLRAF